MKYLFTIPVFIFIAALSVSGGSDDKSKKLGKQNQNDRYMYISVNNILMWISNNGDGSHNPGTDGQGLIWPGGITGSKGAIYEDGLLFGAKVGNEIRVNGNTHRQGLQAGKIIDGKADNPSLEKYRVYKIRKGWEKLPPGAERDALEKDYNEWPIEDGAPYVDVNGDGKPTSGIDKPKHVGDETLWYVANDMDSLRSRYTYGTNPMGLEFQTTVFAFKNASVLYDMVFKKYKIINKGNNILKDMIISYWSDPDLGDNDDYVGLDTTLNLGYVWNGDNDDEIYGTPPPAAGYVYLQGPAIPGSVTDSARFGDGYKYGYKNLPLTAFIRYTNLGSPWLDPPQGVQNGSIQFYNYMQGKFWDGSPMLNPLAGDTVTKMVPGDPVTGTGWYDGPGWPGGPHPPVDVRLLLSSGPFNMNPGDTQEVVIGVVIGRGTNYLNSITVLRKHAADAIELYNNFFKINPPVPPEPALHTVPMDGSITLWWEKSDEEYSETDPLLNDTIYYYTDLKDIIIPVPDKNFNFEGYRIWQFSDKDGNNPEVIATIDKKNGITSIRHYLSQYFGTFFNLTPYAAGEDKGIYRYKIINTSGDELLNNGSPYYFGITAYAYSKYSDPPVIESEPHVIEAIPGRSPVDAEYTHDAQSYINFQHINSNGDGEVKAKVIDPILLNGNEYDVVFKDSLNTIKYFLINKTIQDTLINGSTDYSVDSLEKEIIDGFTLAVNKLNPQNRYIKNIREIKGPGGSEITPVNVFSTYTAENKNSTGEWTILSINERQYLTYNLEDLAYREYVGIDNYEIRFTAGGSEYYSTGYKEIAPIQSIDPKGKGKIPFEVWKIPNDTTKQQVRLIIKIFDSNKDTSWTLDSTTGQWESFYTFEPPGVYPEPLPPTSIVSTGAVNRSNYRIGNVVIKGNQPQTGTVIKLTTWKPLSSLDKFSAVMTAPRINDNFLTKQNINNISAFPNPYFRSKSLTEEYHGYVRFTNLPKKIIIRIYSLSGVFIKKIEKDEEGQYADWDLRNKDGQQVASGIYLAYLEIPGVATKVMKIAVVN